MIFGEGNKPPDLIEILTVLTAHLGSKVISKWFECISSWRHPVNLHVSHATTCFLRQNPFSQLSRLKIGRTVTPLSQTFFMSYKSTMNFLRSQITQTWTVLVSERLSYLIKLKRHTKSKQDSSLKKLKSLQDITVHQTTLRSLRIEREAVCMQYHLQSGIEEGKDQPNLWEIESESVCLSFLHLFSAPPSLLPSFVVLLESGNYVLQRCGVVTSSHEKRTVCQQKQSITRQHMKNKSPMRLDPWFSSVVVTLIQWWHISELRITFHKELFICVARFSKPC